MSDTPDELLKVALLLLKRAANHSTSDPSLTWDSGLIQDVDDLHQRASVVGEMTKTVRLEKHLDEAKRWVAALLEGRLGYSRFKELWADFVKRMEEGK